MPRPTKAQLLAQLEATQSRLSEVEASVRRLGNLVEIMLEALSGMMLVLDEHGVITQAELSSEWGKRWQADTLVGQSLSAFVSPPALNSLQLLLGQVRQQQRPVVFEHTGLGEDTQGVYEWRLSYRPEVGNLAVVRRLDVATGFELERQVRNSGEMLARVNRLTRLGELVASLVHELMQPLTAILHYGQACLQRLSHSTFQTQEVRYANQQIVQQAQRGIQIMERIRRFLRGQEPPIGPVNLNDVVQESISLLSGEITANKVQLDLHMSPAIPPISGDAVQLTQVLVNLIRNALDALANRQQPRIIIATQRSTDYVEVVVADNGPGLTGEVQARLFEPFFSTKPQGLGMGLVVSRTIVEAHGGTLLAENWEEGARFRVRLPLPTASLAEVSSPSASNPPTTAPLSGEPSSSAPGQTTRPP